jgi:glycosyltransferase involved in cell wall biosynthesis
MAKGHLYAGVAAKRVGVPVVWWQHTIPGSRIDRVAARVPAAAVVCGSDVAVAAQRAITPRNRIVKVHPGTAVGEVAARRGSGAPLRRRLGWGEAPVVGVVGRLQAWKGQDVFLRAAALLADDDPKVRFAVVGGAILGLEGSYPRDLHALAAELGVEDRVHFAGHQEDVYPWLDALDVVVHSSLAEPFGLVIVEAMALGKPVVATNVAGPTEIIEEGVSGLLVPPDDPERLAQAVRRVLDDPALGERLGGNAASRAAQFTDERAAAAFAAVIASVLGGVDAS